jgi:hypothetical protein
MRSMVLFGLLAGVALTVPSGAADAQRLKCTASSRLMSSPVTWICKASEKCCYDYWARKGICLSSSSRCFLR